MHIIDSGVHIWGGELELMPGRTPHLPQPLTADQLLAMMDESGVERAILVPPSWFGDSNEYCIRAAQAHPARFTVMGRFPLDRPEMRSSFEEWASQPEMLGVRLTMHHPWDERWIADGTADWFWADAERLRIPVMVNAPRLLDELASVAAQHPGLRLIIDHTGQIRGTKDDELADGVRRMAKLAALDNIYVKLTMVPTRSSDRYPYLNIHPYIREVIEAFGPRRSFWGSEASALLSRTECSYAQNVTLFTEHMDFLSADDLKWVMGGGLAECLDWPSGASASTA